MKNNKVDDSLKWMGILKTKEHTPQCSKMLASDDKEAILTKCDCDGFEQSEIKNLVLTSGLQSIIEKLVDTENQDESNGFVSYLEIGMSDTAPLAAQTGLIKPKARKFIAHAYRDATNAVFEVFFNGTQANSNESTVTIGTSTSQFTVLGGGGALFSIGELIEVGLGTPEITEITNISTDTITVNPPLASIPSGGEYVRQAYKELGLFGGSSANSTIGSGIAFARTTDMTARTKLTDFGLTIEWHVALT